MTDYDTMVVGAGPAGTATALTLAKNGVHVALIDRGSPVGSKNLSGGVLWGNDLGELLPNWQQEAPVERYITTKKVGFLTKQDSMIVNWRFDEDETGPHNGYSVLRAKFDKWLAQQAEEQGVDVFEGINVENLLMENGDVKGIIQDGNEFRTKAVVIADGANSRLLINSGIRKTMQTKHYMLGVKEVLRLPKERIEDRFQLQGDEGASHEFIIGYLPAGVKAGGFLYTNKDTLSLGVVVYLDTLVPGISSYEIFEVFKNHPTIQRFIKDAETIEYGAHLVPSGGIEMVPKLYGNGYVIVGDAAGLVFSNGLLIHGMGPAIRSGIVAGNVLADAIKNGDTSAQALKQYEKALNKTYVIQNLKRFKNIKKLTKNPRLFDGYPDVLIKTFKGMFIETGQPKEHLKTLAFRALKEEKISKFTALKDAYQGGTAL